jgi:FKBP-type peptidyl-prolyl cis-trans isomerase
MKHLLRPTLTMAALAVALGMTASVQAAQTAKSSTVDKTKASYVVGWDLASSLPPIVRQEIDPATVARAVQSELSGQKPTMSETEYKSVKEAFVTQLRAKAKAQFDKEAAKNKAAGEAFMAKNRHAAGVKVTASGLQYKVLSQGSGARPGPNDTVKVNYVGKLVDGTVFDDSSKHGSSGPAAIPLANVIPGFREGLELMQTGGHYQFFIPSNLAYGAEPRSEMPPNETLIFDVTLVSTGPTKGGAAPDAGQK